MVRNSFVCLALALCLITGFAFAQEAPKAASQPAETEKLPTLDEVLGRFVEASGGAAALDKLQSFVGVGTFETMGNLMQLEMASKLPDKWYFVLKMGDNVVYSQMSNGSQGWVIDQNGTQPMPDVQRTTTAAMIDVRFPVRIREHFANLSVKAKSKSEGRDAWVVEAQGKFGAPMSLYFDTTSGLLVETDMTADTPNGTFQIQNFMEDFRDVNGIKSAFSMRSTGANDWTIKFSDVKYNVEIADSKFENAPAAAPTTP